MVRLWLWRAAFAGAVAGTAYLMLTPVTAPPPELGAADKAVHFTVFAGNGLLVLPAFPDRGRNVAFLCLLLLGGVLEGLQAFVPFRQASAGDAIANLLGIGAVWVAARASRPRRAMRG